MEQFSKLRISLNQGLSDDLESITIKENLQNVEFRWGLTEFCYFLAGRTQQENCKLAKDQKLETTFRIYKKNLQ